MLHGPDEPVYTIGVAARLLGVTPQVLRQIEHEGLIEPRRTMSNIRLYSENDLKRLQRVIHLLRDEGINAAGVRFILAAEEEARSSGDTGPPPSSAGRTELTAVSPGESHNRTGAKSGGFPSLPSPRIEEPRGEHDVSGEAGERGHIALARPGCVVAPRKRSKSWRGEDGV